MLYYLKVEVLGEAAGQSLEGIPARYYISHNASHHHLVDFMQHHKNVRVI